MFFKGSLGGEAANRGMMEQIRISWLGCEVLSFPSFPVGEHGSFLRKEKTRSLDPKDPGFCIFHKYCQLILVPKTLSGARQGLSA